MSLYHTNITESRACGLFSVQNTKPLEALITRFSFIIQTFIIIPNW